MWIGIDLGGTTVRGILVSQGGRHCSCGLFTRPVRATFGLALTSLESIFNPELFILGGGLIETAYFWWDEISTLIQKSPQIPQIKKAALGSQAGLWGAVRLAQQGG